MAYEVITLYYLHMLSLLIYVFFIPKNGKQGYGI